MCLRLLRLGLMKCCPLPPLVFSNPFLRVCQTAVFLFIAALFHQGTIVPWWVFVMTPFIFHPLFFPTRSWSSFCSSAIYPPFIFILLNPVLPTALFLPTAVLSSFVKYGVKMPVKKISDGMNLLEWHPNSEACSDHLDSREGDSGDVYVWVTHQRERGNLNSICKVCSHLHYQTVHLQSQGQVRDIMS